MDTCSAVGCFKPRHKSTGGYEYSYCYDHWLQRMEGFKWEEQPQKEAMVMVKSDVCTVEGCGKSRMRNRQGEMLTMCEDHQRAYWRDQATKRQKPQAEPKHITIANSVAKVLVVEETESPDTKRFTVAVNPIEHDCDPCEAKAVIEALRAKSPKLAKLIDALQAEVEAAAALGL